MHILRESSDPLAVSIAQQELLELLHVAPNVYIDPDNAALDNNDSASMNASISSNIQPNVTSLAETA